MFEWSDVWKIALGFASSLILMWVKEIFVHHRQVAGLRKSLWSMMEFESDLEVFIGALDRMKTSISEGNLRLVAFDVPKSITRAAEELAHLEPKSAYVYNDLHSHAEIVRNGLSFLRDLIKSLSTMRPNPDDEVRLRDAIIGQICILKNDRLNLGQAELRVLKHIKGHQHGLNQSTMDRMETALGKFQKG
jgi:hypothetical protein